MREFDLWRALPGAAVAFTLATAASMGLPGFSGFVAEISVAIGLWQSYPVAGAGGRAGHRHHRRVFVARPAQGVLPGADTPADAAPPVLPPLTWPEISAISLLIAVSLAIGIYPKPWVVLIDDGLRSPLFQSILSQP